MTNVELGEAARLCSERLGYAYALNDYVIRRAGFMAQQRQGDAIAVLVMVITLSGVAMAAFQMVTAYRLAQREGGGATPPEASSLSLEAGKLSVQTSVTGILVLGLSLGFFTIYVLNVYKIEFAPESSPPAANASILPELGVGIPEGESSAAATDAAKP